MDFDKKAREIIVRMSFPLCPPNEAPTDRELIAAALKSAYNAGLEDAADAANAAQHRITSGISHVTAQGHRSACWLIEQTIRAKKVP